jgi:hypothetical protein
MYSGFKVELDAYLATNWSSTPIHDFSNKSGDPDGYDPWMGYRPVILSDEVQSIAQGPHCILGSYGIEFSIMIGSAEGQALAITLSEELKALFIGKQIGANIDVIQTDTEFGVKDQDESSGKWYKTIVFVTFEYRYFI